MGSPQIEIPQSALDELDMVEQMDWSDGVGLEELINWINQVVARFRPDEIDDSKRSSTIFTTRSFRHYQTLGCIDSPTRKGKSAIYGFRHYLQGLLVRKLLWEKVSSEQMATLMKGKSNEEYRNLLLQGIRIVSSSNISSSDLTTWRRFNLAKGVEIHFEESALPLDAEQIGEIQDQIRAILSTQRKS